MVEHDSTVRNAALALSAQHEYYVSNTGAFLAEYSLHHYQKALRQVIRLSEPDASFDAILGVCVIACQIESLRGGYEAATRHAIAGMRMIADQRSANQKSGLGEEELRSIFTDLQFQVLEANADEFHIHYPNMKEEVGPVPTAFKGVEDALPHLHVIGMRLFTLFEKAEGCEAGNWPASMPAELFEEYELTRAIFEEWAEAIARTESIARRTTGQQFQGLLVLKIFEASIRVDLDIFPRGEEAYDDFIAHNHGILKLVEVFLLSQGCNVVSTMGQDGQPSPKSRYFTSALGIVGLLFEIASRTADKSLCDEAVRLLRLAKRREGIWDSDAAANLLEKIKELEDHVTAIRGDNPRIKFVITEIRLVSDQKCLINYGFKQKRPGYFHSHWFEDIRPGEGVIESVMLDIS